MRNANIETATDLLIDKLDHLIQGGTLSGGIDGAVQSVLDLHISGQGGSVRLACAFFVVYAVIDNNWDFRSVPVGIRGQFGDKKLASALTARHVTYHKSITAFGENLGWKGNVRQFDLSSDPRFSSFLSKLSKLLESERLQLLEHVAWRLFESRVVPIALPALPQNYLTYGRALALCQHLLRLPTEGHIQQFLVAGFLAIHRRRYGGKIITHHPHAADKFDNMVGDIQEYHDDRMVAAYEVTVRDDWKNRLWDFKAKMDRGGLSKYVILAANVHDDVSLYPADRLMDFTANISFDLAVVDLKDFFAVFCAEMTHEEIGQAINRAYEFLAEPVLSGREDFMNIFRVVTQAWIG